MTAHLLLRGFAFALHDSLALQSDVIDPDQSLADEIASHHLNAFSSRQTQREEFARAVLDSDLHLHQYPLPLLMTSRAILNTAGPRLLAVLPRARIGILGLLRQCQTVGAFATRVDIDFSWQPSPPSSFAEESSKMVSRAGTDDSSAAAAGASAAGALEAGLLEMGPTATGSLEGFGPGLAKRVGIYAQEDETYSSNARRGTNHLLIPDGDDSPSPPLPQLDFEKDLEIARSKFLGRLPRFRQILHLRLCCCKLDDWISICPATELHLLPADRCREWGEDFEFRTDGGGPFFEPPFVRAERDAEELDKNYSTALRAFVVMRDWFGSACKFSKTLSSLSLDLTAASNVPASCDPALAEGLRAATVAAFSGLTALQRLELDIGDSGGRLLDACSRALLLDANAAISHMKLCDRIVEEHSFGFKEALSHKKRCVTSLKALVLPSVSVPDLAVIGGMVQLSFLEIDGAGSQSEHEENGGYLGTLTADATRNSSLVHLSLPLHSGLPIFFGKHSTHHPDLCAKIVLCFGALRFLRCSPDSEKFPKEAVDALGELPLEILLLPTYDRGLAVLSLTFFDCAARTGTLQRLELGRGGRIEEAEAAALAAGCAALATGGCPLRSLHVNSYQCSGWPSGAFTDLLVAAADTLQVLDLPVVGDDDNGFDGFLVLPLLGKAHRQLRRASLRLRLPVAAHDSTCTRAFTLGALLFAPLQECTQLEALKLHLDFSPDSRHATEHAPELASGRGAQRVWRNLTRLRVFDVSGSSSSAASIDDLVFTAICSAPRIEQLTVAEQMIRLSSPEVYSQHALCHCTQLKVLRLPQAAPSLTPPVLDQIAGSCRQLQYLDLSNHTDLGKDLRAAETLATRLPHLRGGRIQYVFEGGEYDTTSPAGSLHIKYPLLPIKIFANNVMALS